MPRIDAVRKGADGEAVFQDRLARIAHDTEALLDRLLSSIVTDGGHARPARLLEAMRYASLGGGKRLRPFLVVESARLFDVPRPSSLMAGAALECVHCYSLVHDDLPSMDNDDLRRGRPTAHRAFDEATAVLAGDGLLTFAFDILSRPETHPDADVRLKLVSCARSRRRSRWDGGRADARSRSGRALRGLAARARRGGCHDPAGDEDRRALALRLSRRSNPGQGRSSSRGALERYGSAIGEAFQIADDLLDLEGDPATVGKATGKDAAAHKATLVGVLGPAAARTPARRADCRGSVGPCTVRERWRCAQGCGPLRRHTQRLNEPGGRRSRVGADGIWYSWVDSNHRPLGPQPSALTN